MMMLWLVYARDLNAAMVDAHLIDVKAGGCWPHLHMPCVQIELSPVTRTQDVIINQFARTERAARVGTDVSRGDDGTIEIGDQDSETTHQERSQGARRDIINRRNPNELYHHPPRDP